MDANRFKFKQNYCILDNEGVFFAMRLNEINQKSIKGEGTILSTAYSNDGTCKMERYEIRYDEIIEVEEAEFSPEEYIEHELKNNPK